jgi:hypothetical protein
MELTPAQFSELRESLTSLASQSQAPEKRRFMRLPVSGQITLTQLPSGKAHTAMTRDLSQSGMGVIQSIAARAGDRYVATLPRTDDNSLQVVCTVMDARPLAEGLYSVHLQFERTA